MQIHEMPVILNVIRQELSKVATDIFSMCNALINKELIPVKLNTRTSYVAVETLKSLLVEKKIITSQEFDDLFKTKDYNLAVAEKKAVEEENNKVKISSPS